MAYHPGCGGGKLGGWMPPHSITCRLNMTVFDKLILTIQKITGIIVLEQVFGIVSHERGRVF